MRVLVSIVLLSCFAAELAHAQPIAKKRIIVLESHAGQRSAEFGRFMDSAADVLETHGFAARPASILSITGPGVPRPGVLDEGLTAAAIAKKANDGIAKYGVPDCKQALELLTPAVEKIERNPALLVVDTSNLDLTFKARGTIAVCDERQGDSRAARRAMREAIRTSPQRPIYRNDMWGPEGEKLYRDTMAEVKTLGRGQLSIAAGDLDAAIFVDGQLRGIGHAEIADMIPGTAHVFLRPPGNGPGNVGRQYEVEVKANETTSLIVDAKLDSIIRITDAYAALVFAGTEEQAKLEAKLGTDFSQRWAGSDTVVLVTSETLSDGRSAAVARLVQGGREKRAARVPIDGTSQGLASLARFLAEGEEGPGMDVLRSDAGARPATRGRSAPWWTIALIGSGIAAMGASAIVYAVSPADDFTQPTYDDKRTPAVVVFSGAATVTGAGVLAYLTKSRHMSLVPATMVAAGTSAALMGSMFIVTDEDLHDEGWQRPTYRNTATAGVILVGAAVGLGTTGYILSRRGSEEHAIPTVAITREGASFGIAGRF